MIAEVGRTEQRRRSLPARVMAYFSIGMALYSEGADDHGIPYLGVRGDQVIPYPLDQRFP